MEAALKEHTRTAPYHAVPAEAEKNSALGLMLQPARVLAVDVRPVLASRSLVAVPSGLAPPVHPLLALGGQMVPQVVSGREECCEGTRCSGWARADHERVDLMKPHPLAGATGTMPAMPAMRARTARAPSIVAAEDVAIEIDMMRVVRSVTNVLRVGGLCWLERRVLKFDQTELSPLPLACPRDASHDLHAAASAPVLRVGAAIEEDGTIDLRAGRERTVGG